MTTPTAAYARGLIIIGGGPAGFTAATYAARANLAPIVLVGTEQPGGALTTTTEVENFPGFPAGVQGPELMAQMQEQAERFGADVRYQNVTAVDLTGEVKTVTTDEGETLTAAAVILATGAAHKHLGVPGEEEFAGRGVSYCATCDGFFFQGETVAVVGGGDTAMEEALYLTHYAAKVIVVHRREELRASKVMADRALAHERISFAFNAEVETIRGEEKVTGVTLRDTVTGELSEVSAGAVFIAIGHTPRSELFAAQGVLRDADGYIRVSHPSTQTNLEGVFACGDVVDRHYRQAITAAGTGCAAALDAERHLARLADAVVA